MVGVSSPPFSSLWLPLEVRISVRNEYLGKHRIRREIRGLAGIRSAVVPGQHVVPVKPYKIQGDTETAAVYGVQILGTAGRDKGPGCHSSHGWSRFQRGKRCAQSIGVDLGKAKRCHPSVPSRRPGTPSLLHRYGAAKIRSCSFNMEPVG